MYPYRPVAPPRIINKKSPAQQARHAVSKAAQAQDIKDLFHGLDEGKFQGRFALQLQNQLMLRRMEEMAVIAQESKRGQSWPFRLHTEVGVLGGDRLSRINRRLDINGVRVYRGRRNEYRTWIAKKNLKAAGNN